VSDFLTELVKSYSGARCTELSKAEKETFLFAVVQGVHILVLILNIEATTMVEWMRMYASLVACTLQERQGGFVGFCTTQPS
jgi:hypothetical protein